MSSEALGQAGYQKAKSVLAKFTEKSQSLRLAARRGGWSMPMGIVGITAGFWLLIWLISLLKTGPFLSSPVGVLLTVYGLGIAALISVVAIGVAGWLAIRQLGLAHYFQTTDDD